MKLISIVTPTYNEEENVAEVYKQVKQVFADLKDYQYEHIFIDNASKDKTVEILKGIAQNDKNVKIIVNSRNFEAMRSHYYGLLQSKGDAAISIVADLQDPPSMIPELIKKWESGYKVVIGIIKGRKESFPMVFMRNLYYKILGKLSNTELIKHFTGFGLYDKKVVESLRQINDMYPYLRGIIAEIGFETARIEYVQPARHKGRTTTNLYYLYNLAMVGITSYSKIPLRLATIVGFVLGTISFLTAFTYLVYKIIFWQSFSLGIAPIVIGLFFFASVQLFFLGILGEYIGAIHTQIFKRPLVIEKERINFDI
ncbi:MAG: glycosyltransferase family 2 protein [Candidatus Brocadiia bacterium]